MFLSQNAKTSLYKAFPQVELSYEDNAYKKVHGADIYLALSRKNKRFAWFTHYNHKSVCFVIDIVNEKLGNIRSYPCCFDSSLSLGTLVYGSLVTKDKQSVFCVEDILQYAGKQIDKLHWNTRMSYLSRFMKHTKPVSFSKDFLIMSMPLFSTSYKELELFIEHSIYDVDYIQSRRLDSQKFLNFNINQINRNERTSLPVATFLVTPCIQTDIYNLFCYSNGKEFYGTANIPDFKTSKLMNSLFRNIRENARLDAIEESDEEDEFENINEDKYVYTDRDRIMKCVYSFRFKRWTPIETLDSSSKLTTRKDLKLLEKKN